MKPDLKVTKIVRRKPAWMKRNPGYRPLAYRHGIIRDRKPTLKLMLRNLIIALIVIAIVALGMLLGYSLISSITGPLW
jgi:hypothetical protein